MRFRARACCNNDIPVIYDAFSTKYETDVASKEIMVEKIYKSVSDSFVCKRNVEMTSGTVGTVIDLWGDAAVISSRIDNEELCVNGNLGVYILAYDSESNPIYIERSVDFDCKTAVMGGKPQMRSNSAVRVKNIGYTIIDNCNIEISAELELNSCIYDISKFSVVNDIVVSEKCVKKANPNSAMIIYYAEKGESVWDIARKFNSSPDEISEINSIESKEVNCNKALLIPIK